MLECYYRQTRCISECLGRVQPPESSFIKDLMPATAEDIRGSGKRWAVNAFKVGFILAGLPCFCPAADSSEGWRGTLKVYRQAVQGNGKHKVSIKGQSK